MKKITLLVLSLVLASCATNFGNVVVNERPDSYYGIYASDIGRSIIYHLNNSLENQKKEAPSHAKLLLEDNQLDVGVVLGANEGFDSSMNVIEKGYTFTIDGIKVNLWFFDTKEDLENALGTLELVVYVGHSRYGIGPAFGKLSNSFEMQSDVLSMSKEDLYGYQVEEKRILSESENSIRFRGSTKDIDSAKRYPKFQLIVMASCSSYNHFRNELEKFSLGYQRVIILTDSPVVGFCNGVFVERLIEGILLNETLQDTIDGMNQVYESASEERGDEIVYDNIFKVGVNTLK